MMYKLLILSVVVLGGCPKETSRTRAEDSSAKRQQASPQPAKAMPRVPTAPPKGASPVVPLTPGVKVGIAVCDQFLRDHRVCISKMPESMRALAFEGLKSTEQAWASFDQRGKGRSKLYASCLVMLEETKTAMAAYGCTYRMKLDLFTK